MSAAQLIADWTVKLCDLNTYINSLSDFISVLILLKHLLEPWIHIVGVYKQLDENRNDPDDISASTGMVILFPCLVGFDWLASYALLHRVGD